MASQIMKNCKVWLGGYDLSGDLNALALEYSADMVEETTFGDDTHINVGGLKGVTAAHEGYVNTANSDSELFGKIGLSNVPFTASPVAGADGDVAYTFVAIEGSYNPLNGAIGELNSFSVEASAADGLVRGVVLSNAAAITSSGTTTGQNIGAVSATQELYVTLHVFTAPGTAQTLDVVVESDSDNSFASATTRATFAQTTDITSENITVAGAITDTWYRVDYTIGGGSDPFSFVVILGIR